METRMPVSMRNLGQFAVQVCLNVFGFPHDKGGTNRRVSAKTDNFRESSPPKINFTVVLNSETNVMLKGMLKTE